MLNKHSELSVIEKCTPFFWGGGGAPDMYKRRVSIGESRASIEICNSLSPKSTYTECEGRKLLRMGKLSQDNLPWKPLG